MGDISDSIFMKKLSPLNGIYIVYTVLSRGICNNIPPQPRHFFILGLRPRTKKCLGFGGILLDIPLKNTVYTLHICLIISYICPEISYIRPVISYRRPVISFICPVISLIFPFYEICPVILQLTDQKYSPLKIEWPTS